MNTEYLLWFATVVVVTAAAILWLVFGDVPELPPDPGAESAAADGSDASPGTAREPWP